MRYTILLILLAYTNGIKIEHDASETAVKSIESAGAKLADSIREFGKKAAAEHQK